MIEHIPEQFKHTCDLCKNSRIEDADHMPMDWARISIEIGGQFKAKKKYLCENCALKVELVFNNIFDAAFENWHNTEKLK